MGVYHLGNPNKQVQHSNESFTTLAIHHSRLSSTSAIVATVFWFNSSRIPLGFTSGKRSFKLAAQPLIDGYKIYRSFARFAATVACKFSPCHRTDQPMTIPGCPGLFGFAMWIVAITIVLITHDKLPLNPEAYAYLPAPCHTELECDIVAYPTAMLNVWVVLLGLFYVIAILISSLARRTRFLSFITLGMCTVLVVLLYIFFFRYVCLHMIGVGHAQLIMFFSGPEAVGGTQPAGTSLA